jgi:hypothetical protein
MEPNSQPPGTPVKKKRSYYNWFVIAGGWVYLLISSPWMRWVALAAAAASAVVGLAIWIANKSAKS